MNQVHICWLRINQMYSSVSGGPSEEMLIILDQLAHGLIESIDALRFDIARDDSQREAVYRLRYQTVIERGWAQPGEMPDGREHDHYDDKAIHIVGWDGNKLATTSRIVLPEDGLILPTEEAFHIQVEPRGQVADMGRQIVAREYSSIKHKVFAALLAKTWLEIRAHGYSLVCGDFSPAMMRLYRIMGFDIKQLGPAKSFWGEERAPIVVNVAQAMLALVERWGNQKPTG
jgi:N-acyl-L-homoserine lactone synthetase